MMRGILTVVVLALAGAGAFWYVQDMPGLHQGASEAAGTSARRESRPIPVVIRPVERRPMPERLATIGTVQPLASVAIRARVDSVVEEVHFSEGQEVAAGDPLFTLDARTLQAQLQQALANLERDRAHLEKAREDIRRYSELLKRNAASRQQYEAAEAAAQAYAGTVKADEAAVEAARVALGHTRIVAPMAGRTGVVNAKPGASVRAADATPLVTLTQMRPIAVAFNIPERFLPSLRTAMAAGPLAVAAEVSGSEGPPAEGVLTFIDSQVDQQTGTILAKAEFPNTDTRLWPGQFVDVVLTLRVDPDALVVPAEAALTGQQGRFVFVVKPDGTVEMRPVTVARTQDGLAVIGDGLKPGEPVVVDGQSRLVPGALVADRSSGGAGNGEGRPRKDGGAS